MRINIKKKPLYIKHACSKICAFTKLKYTFKLNKLVYINIATKCLNLNQYFN